MKHVTVCVVTHDLTSAILYNKNITQSSVIEQARRVCCPSIKKPTIHVNWRIPVCNILPSDDLEVMTFKDYE